MHNHQGCSFRQELLATLAAELNCHPSDALAFPRDLTSVTEAEKIAEFSAKYQLYNLNRKAEADVVSEDQRSASFQKFLEIQSEMEEYNKFFRPSRALEEARRIIRHVLPEFHFVRDQVWSSCTFGPGTFHGAVKDKLGSSTHYKIGGDQTVTGPARDLALKVILEFFPNWAEELKSKTLTTVDGNRPSHVPKDVEKCRPISIEPSLNVFLQQGVGRWLGRHMKEIGFADIHDGQAVNRRLASDLSNATIDLSNASDTISCALVRYLLPWDWYAVMATIRSPNWAYRGKKGIYHNFSSQGNAFTFPLETLIFKAICMAYTGLSQSEVTVYGDDIIVPQTAAIKAVYGLQRSGFTVNQEKSYWGQHNDERKWFRESCGADWYRGTLVTPVYYRKEASRASDFAVLFNRLVEAWPMAEQTHSLILSKVDKPLIGPRFFISGHHDKWLTQKKVQKTIGLNAITSIYDGYFWSESILEGREASGRIWVTKGKEIPPSKYLSARSAELTFLLTGRVSQPRDAGVKYCTIRRDVTPCLIPVERGCEGVPWFAYVNHERSWNPKGN